MEIKIKPNLTEWVKSYTNDLYNWAFHKVSDIEFAKDLVQETFLAAAEKISSFKGDSSPKTWLFSILNHKIIDHYRKKVNQPSGTNPEKFSKFFNNNDGWKPEKQPKDWHEDDTNLLDDKEFQAVLKQCLDALPPQWNTCVKLKYLMSKNGEEICQELDITSSNYWQIVHRAKVQLRDCVETNWFQNL
ncbi:MAG: sigma-70 family RNA polymerase sigma factor [Bacteroidales bacterium]|jgi:RNA polymerase sigma-70 factor (TIGR02943 family)|nr:sigma-70 family RNA polymerase sigma factor [Bacteroidales bacterium]